MPSVISLRVFIGGGLGFFMWNRERGGGGGGQGKGNDGSFGIDIDDI